MIQDPIVEETRLVREGLLTLFGGDLEKYVNHLIEEQTKDRNRLVANEDILRLRHTSEGKR